MSSEPLPSRQHKNDIGRKDLAGEHIIGDAMQLVFLVIFLIVWVLDSFVLHYSTFPAETIPSYVRWPLGILVLIVSFLFARSGMRIIFGEIRETPHVVTKGVFSIVRHPIYLGALGLYLGLILMTLSLVSALLWVPIIIFYRFISAYEEKLLIQIYSDDYREYKKKVPMLLPLKF